MPAPCYGGREAPKAQEQIYVSWQWAISASTMSLSLSIPNSFWLELTTGIWLILFLRIRLAHSLTVELFMEVMAGTMASETKMLRSSSPGDGIILVHGLQYALPHPFVFSLGCGHIRLSYTVLDYDGLGSDPYPK
jgi:hypothetical protein